MGSGAKSYKRKGFLIYEEMRKYFIIYEEAVGHKLLSICYQNTTAAQLSQVVFPTINVFGFIQKKKGYETSLNSQIYTVFNLCPNIYTSLLF